MFDTMQVGRRIRQARIEKNMTQMALADAMGVSYQAVSNWERGNSMPDISKLPELCELLGITFEQLVGGPSRETKTVEKVLEGEPVTIEEVAEVASLLPPETVRESAEKAKGEEVDFSSLMALAPFLDERYMDAMAEQLVERDMRKVIALAPFLSSGELDRLALRARDKDVGVLVRLAPFLGQETLDRLAEDMAGEETPQVSHLVSLAPFLGESTLVKLMDKLQAKGLTWKQLVPFAPFLSQKTLKTLLR